MSVAIVGNGYGALHLALRLQRDGFDAHLLSDRTSKQLLASKLVNTACHFGSTRQSDAALGVDFWREPRYAVKMIRVYLGLPQPVRFEAVLSKQGYMIDHRVYQSRLLDEFASRGGKVTYRNIEQKDLGELSEAYEAVVIATGKGGLQNLFDRIEEYCPIRHPNACCAQRFMTASIFRR